MTCWAEDSGAASTTCQTYTRRFGLRYTHAHDNAPRPHLGEGSSPNRKGDSSVLPMSSDEMLVHHQLIAMDVIEDTPLLSTALMDLPVAPSTPSPSYISDQAQRTVQNIIGFIERSHGLRALGMVAEFVEVAPGGVLVLLSIHAAQWDPRPSRGRLGTFTERWEDFLAGTGPSPMIRAKGSPLTPSSYARMETRLRAHPVAQCLERPVLKTAPTPSHRRWLALLQEPLLQSPSQILVHPW